MADLALPDLGRPLRRVPGPLRVLTQTGRVVLLIAVAAIVLGALAGFTELLLLGVLCTAVLVMGLVMVRLPSRVTARLELRPPRTMAGETGAGLLEITNVGALPLNGTAVEVEIDPRADQRAATLRVPTLATGASVGVEFELPPLPRGVLRIGPARMRRTDPLGLAVSSATWAKPVDLFVRPRMVAIDALGIGYVRDLEGTPSDEISMSDLAFHALREYVRGDDLRHVHWRSSARTGQLHVRQYHDTRRSHVVVLVDERHDAYAGPAEFELAMSIAASVLVRFAQDDFSLTFACGGEQVSGPTGQVLDACCLATLAAGDLVDAARRAAHHAPTASQLVLVTGSAADLGLVHQARTAFAADVRHLTLRSDVRAAVADADTANAPAFLPGVLTVSSLEQLPQLLVAHARGSWQ